MDDATVVRATGNDARHWFGILDGAGAQSWPHRRIARHLAEVGGVDAWWAQSLTVAYEQARGLRLPGQRQDGTFGVSASRTLDLPQADALHALIVAVSQHVGSQPAAVNCSSRYANARWALPDGRSVQARTSPPRDGRTATTLTCSRIADAAQVAQVRVDLRRWLASAG